MNTQTFNLVKKLVTEGLELLLNEKARHFELEKQLHELALRCKELEEENMKLKEMNNF